MNLDGDMDAISLPRSKVDRSSTHRKTKRKVITATSVWCERNKKTQAKQATSLISALPEELLVEILSRLPPKPFFRCRSICKYWLSLSSVAFGRNKHLQPTLHGLFHNYYSYNGGSFPSFSFAAFSYMSSGSSKVESGDGKISALPCLNRVKVLDCCNGLLLLSALRKRPPYVKEIYVYNPATQSLSALGSLSKFQHMEHSYAKFSLAFDTRAPSLLHLICFTAYVKEEVVLSCVDIFSFEEGKCKCKQGKELTSDMIINPHTKGTFLDRRMHRLTIQNKKILSIDPNNCSYEVIRLPDLENLTLAEIGQSQGLLNFMSVCNDKTLGIWVLKSYHLQEWTMKYQLRLHQIYSVPEPYCDAFDAFDVFDICNRMKFGANFAFHPQEDVLFMPLVPSGLLTFDLRTSKGEELLNLGGYESFACWVYLPFYSV